MFIIEGNPGADNAKMRKAGFEKAAKEGGLKVLVSRTAHWETEEANTLVTNLLTSHPDVQGIMAANDSMALGVVKALDAAGRSGKVQVVGFDNIPESAMSDPSLTTVDQFIQQMGFRAVELLLSLLAGKPPEHMHLTLPTELVMRQSTAPPSAP